MNIRLGFFAMILCSLALPSCVSAWMTAGTGVTIKRGMTRTEVHRKLGSPSYSKDGRSSNFRDVMGNKADVRVVDVHLYRGKINSIDEGSGQAIANALTLGTAEVFMIPMTAADIAVRSGQSHRIDIAYDKNMTVLDHSVTEAKTAE